MTPVNALWGLSLGHYWLSIVYLPYWFLEGDSQNLQMLNGRFKTTSGHFICQLHEYLSQNLGSNGHFEVLNKSESLFQKYDKNENMQKRIKRQKHYTDFFFFTKLQKNGNGNICILFIQNLKTVMDYLETFLMTVLLNF